MLSTKSLFLFTLAVLPFWGVFATQVGYFVGGGDFFNATKYLLFLGICLCLFLGLLANWKAIALNRWHFPFLAFVVYCLCHIVGESHLMLKIDGLRYEVLYMFIALLLIACGNLESLERCLPSIQRVVKLFFIQGLVVLFFGLWQLYDVTILEVIFRQSLHEIVNIKLALGFRLVSLLGNPINCGAFLIIVIASAYMMLCFGSNSNFISRLIFAILFCLISVCVIMTLSRLAVLAYLVAILALFVLANRALVSVGTLTLFLVISVGLLVSFADRPELSRFSNLSSASEYTENARLLHWQQAVSKLNSVDVFWGKGLGASSPTKEKKILYDSTQIENSFVSILFQYGVIGLCLSILIILRFYYLATVLKRSHRFLSLFSMVFLLIFIVMSLGNDFHRNSPFSFYFWLIYAYLELSMSSSRKCRSDGEGVYRSKRARELLYAN